MKIQDACLPCITAQTVSCAALIPESDRPAFYRSVFHMLAQLDFNQPAPAAIGAVYQLVKQTLRTEDPYASLRQRVNESLLAEVPALSLRISQASDPFAEALRLAILANDFDFNPIHHPDFNRMLTEFKTALDVPFVLETKTLKQALSEARTVLVLGDNFGEVVIDALFLEQIHQLNPDLNLVYAVRGQPVVNDVIAAGARQAGIHRYAQILSNGDDALGTLLPRTSPEFQAIYHQADLLLCKGQANYECLIDQPEKSRYFLLKIKCSVLALRTDLPIGTLACLAAPAGL